MANRRNSEAPPSTSASAETLARYRGQLIEGAFWHKRAGERYVVGCSYEEPRVVYVATVDDLGNLSLHAEREPEPEQFLIRPAPEPINPDPSRVN